MSKGTKQIRLGRVIRLIDHLQIVLDTLIESERKNQGDEWILGRINQLEADIHALKSEFQLQ